MNRKLIELENHMQDVPTPDAGWDASWSGQNDEPDLRSRTLFWPELVKLPRPKPLIKGVIDEQCLAEIFGPTKLLQL